MNKEYFSHDYNTRNKKKLAAIIHDYKMTGYGLFWVIAEMLHEDAENWMGLDQLTYISIAKESGCEVGLITEFIRKCIDEYKVFIEQDGRFTTERVLRNIEKRLDIKEKRSKAGRAGANAKHLPANAEQMPNGDVAKVGKVKERKGKESKEGITANAVAANAAPTEFDSDKELRKEFSELAIPDNSKDAFPIVKNWIETKNPVFIEPYVTAWNIFASFYKLPAVIRITETRRRKFRTRIRDQGFKFFDILNKAKSSDFIKNGSWFGFDWIMENETNYVKIIEGNYK